MSKLNRLNTLLIVLILVASYVFIGHSPAKAAALRVTNVINGTLGDKSFFDSAERGVERAKAELGIEFKTIELGNDNTKWENGLDDAMADTKNYDVLIVGTFQMVDYLTARADTYPDKH